MPSGTTSTLPLQRAIESDARTDGTAAADCRSAAGSPLRFLVEATTVRVVRG